MNDITSIDIIDIFNAYARKKGYIMKVSGAFAFRNDKKEILRYMRYIAPENSILVYEEKVGRYLIPFVPKDKMEETTRQRRLSSPEWINC